MPAKKSESDKFVDAYIEAWKDDSDMDNTTKVEDLSSVAAYLRKEYERMLQGEGAVSPLEAKELYYHYSGQRLEVSGYVQDKLNKLQKMIEKIWGENVRRDEQPKKPRRSAKRKSKSGTDEGNHRLLSQVKKI